MAAILKKTGDERSDEAECAEINRAQAGSRVEMSRSKNSGT